MPELTPGTTSKEIPARSSARASSPPRIRTSSITSSKSVTFFWITIVPRTPGRFAGCVVGVRVLDDGSWYGEGEVKMYRDGDLAAGRPTICGTGLEDYVGSAWGMGAHAAPFGGAPVDVRRGGTAQPAFVGFYRWHVPDPVVFERELTVTIQQIGMRRFPSGRDGEAAFEAYAAAHPAAGDGWFRGAPFTSLLLACVVILAAAVVLWHLVERRCLLRSSHYVEMTKIPPAGR